MNGSVLPEGRLQSFCQSLQAAWRDDDGLAKPMARMYHRRQVGKLFFFDTLMVDPMSKESFLVELVCCNDSGCCRDGFESHIEDGVTLKDLRPGDVLELLAAQVAPEPPRAPCHVALRCFRLRRSEAWSELFGPLVEGSVAKPEWMPAKYGFHRPVFHDSVNQSWFDQMDAKQLQKRDEKRQLMRHEKMKAQGKDWNRLPKRSARRNVKRKTPSRLLPSGGSPRSAIHVRRILSPCTRDRLVMLYQEAGENEEISGISGRLKEGHLHSIVQRIYLLNTRQKATSLRNLVKGLAGTGKVKPLIDGSPWAMEFATRPTGNGYTLEGSPSDKFDALILPKDRCDTIVYADGLFWWAPDSPRTIIPSRDSRMVPSGAYWKLLEIIDRYPGDGRQVSADEELDDDKQSRKGGNKELLDLYSQRSLALDIGASPGGWSYCLAKELKTRRVIACDPAAYMHPVVRNLEAEALREEFLKDFTSEEVKEDAKHLKHLNETSESWRSEAKLCGQICHWRMRGQDGLQKLKAEELKLSLFVCDMNDDLESSCELLYRVFNEKLYEPPCLAVVTFKNTCKSKSEFQARKNAMIQKILNDGVLTQLQELHLFANTRMETTILGQMLFLHFHGSGHVLQQKRENHTTCPGSSIPGSLQSQVTSFRA
eukprot:s112_g27.t1